MERKELPTCACCDSLADPRFYVRHPVTGVSLMVCDGCYPDNKSELPKINEKILSRETQTSLSI